MPNKSAIARYLLIAKSIREDNAISLEELQRRYKREVEMPLGDGELGTDEFSKRTLQRDLKAIRSLFGIDIGFDRKRKGYCLITKTSNALYFERMMEAFDMIRIFQAKPLYNEVLFPEVRKANGSEHLHLLMHCANNFCQVRFQHQKYDEDSPEEKIVNPVALKEFNHRWYLLAFVDGNPLVKTYGLDRISAIDMTGKKFDARLAENWKQKFESSYGIIGEENKEPDEIILSFKVLQGRYLKSLPLHRSQQVIVENDEEIRFSLRVHITFDFVMELLSYGDDLVVLSPTRLIKTMKNKFGSALKRYEM